MLVFYAVVRPVAAAPNQGPDRLHSVDVYLAPDILPVAVVDGLVVLRPGVRFVLVTVYLGALCTLDSMYSTRRAAVVSGTGTTLTFPVSRSLMPTTATFFLLPLLSACLFFSRLPKYASSTSTEPGSRSGPVKVFHVSRSLCSRYHAELCFMPRSQPELGSYRSVNQNREKSALGPTRPPFPLRRFNAHGRHT